MRASFVHSLEFAPHQSSLLKSSCLLSSLAFRDSGLWYTQILSHSADAMLSMGLGETSIEADEESFLPFSATSTTSASHISRCSVVSSAKWRRMLRMLLNKLWQLLLFTIPSFFKKNIQSTQGIRKVDSAGANKCTRPNTSMALEALPLLLSSSTIGHACNTLVPVLATRIASSLSCGSCLSSDSSILVQQWFQSSSLCLVLSSHTGLSKRCTAMNTKVSSAA